MVLPYDPADIAAIGNQNESGHTICCPSYACAYAEGKTNGKVDVEYLQKCYSEAAGSDIEFTKYVDASGNTYDNDLLIALDPINFADYLAD